MFADTITLINAAGSDITFKLVKQDGSGTVRFDPTSTLALPHTLAIKHQVTGTGPNAVDRHLIQFVKTFQNSTTGKVVSSTVNLTIAVPRDDAVTLSEVIDDVVSLFHFLSGANFDETDFASTATTMLTIGES